MTENKRFTVDYDITVGNYCLHDECKSKGVDGYIAYLSDEERANNLCDLLNKQDARIKELETRNQRQCERLKEITDLMQNRDWEALEKMVEDWEEAEELLQAEWGTYGDAE